MSAKNPQAPVVADIKPPRSGGASVTAITGRAARDAELMRQIASEQSAEAFNELVAHYAPRLKAWLMHRGQTGSTAEDIVQDSLVTVWQKANLYTASKASFSTWVYRLTFNRWIDHKRKNGRLQPTSPEVMTTLVDTPVQSAETDVDKLQMAAAVQSALARLPKAQKEMLYLSFFEGLSHGEIAQRTGVALGTVKSRIRAPLKQLREQLKTFGSDL